MSDAVDQAVRDRVATDHGSTLFVEAGAGTGKTSSLVARLVSLVVDAGESLATTAVITFTEKAAAELRDRIREELVDVIEATTEPARPDRAGRAAEALTELDGAPVATLHAFAQRLLSEYPIEAGLPPGVEVLDEISSEIEFAKRWERFVDELLDDERHRRLVLLADVLGADTARLRDVAVAFDANWDLVERLVDPDPPAPPPPDSGPVVAALDEVIGLRALCDDPDDKLLAKLDRLETLREDLVAAGEDEIARLEALKAVAGFSVGTAGKAPSWNGRKDDVKEAVAAATARAAAVVDAVAQACITALAGAVRGFTLEEASRRRREGRLDFHDLLVLARQLLEDPRTGPQVRRDARRRYRRILVDEFQDTDPIQVDIAVALASDPDGVSSTGSGPDEGRLFFVGDPKQSIYRFRRADIRVFLEAAQTHGPPLRLVTNWRSSPRVIDWINEVFGDLVQPTPDSQPAYVPLVAGRDDVPAGPGVAVVGAEEHEAGPSADEIREREAADVAATVTAAVSQGWEVRDREAGTPRRCRLGDICILLPARTSLPQLERALDDAGIPYRAESSSLVYSTREVRDVIGVLRAVDDPTDELAVVATLRSAAFGCGDDDLWEYVASGGRWDYHRPAPTGLDPGHPVVDAMAWLAEANGERSWRTPSEMVDRVVRDRGMFELGAARGRLRDQWRRIRFVVDQARAFTDATGGTLREFLGWIGLQSSGSGRVTEAVLPETDDDAVRILTVHASKGLEFPVTILSGLTTQLRRRRGGVRVLWSDREGRPAVNVSFRPDLRTTEFDESLELDEQLDFHEKIRLLYVACTRARDHLVVSLHRTPMSARAVADGSRREDMTAAQLLADAGAARTPVTLSPTPVVLAPGAQGGSPEGPPPRAAWERDLAEARDTLARRRSLAATAVAAEMHDPDAVDAEALLSDAGLAKRARDLDLPPWNKGRYGTAVGRAVHASLQTVDLATGAGLGRIAAAQSAAEGVADRADAVEALARSALANEVVAEAAASPHWREVYVATRVGDRILEGYVDLLYRRSDGLVVVDHKTDQPGDARELARALDRYGRQAAAYALAVEEATGETVAECVLLFLGERDAVAHVVGGLRGRIAEVRDAVPHLVGGRDVTVT